MKSLIIDQMTYSEQMCTRLLNFVANYCQQDYNELVLLQ